MSEPREDAWFGDESRALRYYSKGWIWKRIRDNAGEFWELWAPGAFGLKPTRCAATARCDGIVTISDPMCVGASAHTSVPSAHPPGWELTRAGMRFAIGYMVEMGWARVWDPIAPMRPLVTVKMTGDGDVELKIGHVQHVLTADEAEELDKKLMEVLS